MTYNSGRNTVLFTNLTLKFYIIYSYREFKLLFAMKLK